MRNVCYTAAVRRDHHDCRLAVLAGSQPQALELLRMCRSGELPPGVFRGRKPYGRSLKVAFVYDQQVESWKRFLPQLAQSVPGFVAAVEEIDAVLARVAGWTLASLSGDHPRWGDPHYAQPAALALQLALTAWWRRVGLVPDVVLGQGIGELAAAAAASMLPTDEALRTALAWGAREAQARWLVCRPTRSAAFLDLSQGLAAAVGAISDRHVDICLEIGPRRDDRIDRGISLGQRFLGFRAAFVARRGRRRRRVDGRRRLVCGRRRFRLGATGSRRWALCCACPPIPGNGRRFGRRPRSGCPRWWQSRGRARRMALAQPLAHRSRLRPRTFGKRRIRPGRRRPPRFVRDPI